MTILKTLCAAALAATALAAPALAQEKKTVAYIAPSLDISYWQWVGYGVKQKAEELGMDYVEYTSENSPAKQMDNARVAVTKGVDAIVIGPVSSTSTPPLLNYLANEKIPVAFAGIGPQPGLTNFTSAVTANNYETGKAQGKFTCDLAKGRGGKEVGVLSLPQDRENAQKYLKGAEEAFAAEGCTLAQMLETRGLTVNEAVTQANDMLTAHPDIKAIYGMYDEAGTGAAKVLATRGLTGKVGVSVADGSPTTIGLLKQGAIQGIFFQEAVGQGIDGTQQVYNALTGGEVTQNLALVMPLVTADKVETPEAQKVIARVFPPSN
ncbi:substrate-binding domain-containing protein [Aureimonas phyllosphaerae]|uniref:Ribose transport system substrate-binding protein n=1 Tax=Aureimonas phyllosphaerae TaxID=1166078 RepID=A0A7W6BY71_9HYPH|nr:substrate-binding domain-containing protein [Aureimonas phyllosphaerae]MBB3937318.1 ribose transport system substrate-binding protein [Aureimonas phyllosphaerae]MBB3961325.1 ribose transport system substrate-binding protein [Aureimonas phyllosphaerae]SFF41901.1 monosaccharide ABC transporter substrate-binding protein, CUT2 family [Aureimonas phyllosphaerae]